MPDRTCRSCGQGISRRETKLNAGLCDKCLQAALRAIAGEIAKRRKGS
jgi:hypothetical protein